MTRSRYPVSAAANTGAGLSSTHPASHTCQKLIGRLWWGLANNQPWDEAAALDSWLRFRPPTDVDVAAYSKPSGLDHAAAAEGMSARAGSWTCMVPIGEVVDGLHEIAVAAE
jgi:hypothetical protein